MSEDAMIERAAREEQEELDRKHGQEILDVLKGDAGPRSGDALLQAIAQAHQAKLEEKSDQ